MITKHKLREWGACWSDEDIVATWRRLRLPDKVSPLRVACAHSISVEDRLWVLLRPEVLQDQAHEVMEQIIDRVTQYVSPASTRQDILLWPTTPRSAAWFAREAIFWGTWALDNTDDSESIARAAWFALKAVVASTSFDEAHEYQAHLHIVTAVLEKSSKEHSNESN